MFASLNAGEWLALLVCVFGWVLIYRKVNALPDDKKKAAANGAVSLLKWFFK